MNTGALIITSGKTSNAAEMEPMLRLGSISIVQRLCMTFHLAGVSPIVVVVAKEEQREIEQHMARMPVTFLSDVHKNEDMFESVKAGLSYYENQKVDRILITPVTVPLFSVETIKKLLITQKDAAIPTCTDQKGHPLLLNTKLTSHILQYNGDDGLRGALRHLQIIPESVDVDDPGVYVHSNQFDECEKIVITHSLNNWRPMMKLRIAKESVFFGPGSWQLLSLIESTGSVSVASKYMGISYSKAWKLLNNLESGLGYSVLTRQKGGKGGGSSFVNEKGKALMEWYENIERLCNKSINDIFCENPPPNSIKPF